MQKAIEANKIKIDVNEDTFTSSIFQLLRYLPQSLFLEIIITALRFCNYKTTISNAGELLYVEFWPHWRIKEDEEISNKNYVEPDVFFSFENLDIIVESKRWDTTKHCKQQWKNEIAGYKNEFSYKINNGTKVILLAVGDNLKGTFSHDLDCPVLMCSWRAILKSVVRMSTIRKTEVTYENGYKNVLDDIITAFRIHGFVDGSWFEETTSMNRLRYNYSTKTISQWNPTK